MMDAYCCAAMRRAVRQGYLEHPVSYTKDKKLSCLAPVIVHKDNSRPVFALNLCPWCGAELAWREGGMA